METNNKPRRPRVSIGTLVASTNLTQLACIRTLTIKHYYRPLTFKRVKRVVLNT